MDDTTTVNVNFASEVKADRLDFLWKVTMGVALSIFALTITFMLVLRRL